MDIDTKEIVGLYVGSRSRKAAKRLWLWLPAVIGQCAVAYTDLGKHKSRLCPVRGIKQLGKKQVKLITQSRFNCTMRQRIARLVRKTLSFSKKERESYWCYLAFYPPLQ